jgi:nucleotide-binding universal stress UspA family protein
MEGSEGPLAPPTSLAETIVVGLDGSRDAESAFAFALALADRLRAPMLVIRAWTTDTAPHGTLVSAGYVSSFEEADEKVARVLQREVAPLAVNHSNVQLEFRAKFGQPAAVLIAASAGSLMLVLGRRGRGGFSSLLLGSVSEQCTRHAHCPVLIVRPHEPGKEAGH